MRTALLILAALVLVRAEGQQPGTLDLSFDGDGMLTLPGFGGVDDLKSLPDGRIRVITSFFENGVVVPCVLGLLNDGSVDVSYGLNGVYRITEPVSAARAIIHVDDSLYYAYWTNDTVLFVTRHDGNGNSDASYGINGIAAIQPGIALLPRKVVATNSGALIFGGDRLRTPNPWPYNPNPVREGIVGVISNTGQLDLSFNGTGFRTWSSFPASLGASVMDITLMENGVVGVFVWESSSFFPYVSTFAKMVNTSGVESGTIPVLTGQGGTWPVLLSSSFAGVMSVSQSYWQFPFYNGQKIRVSDMNGGGWNTVVAWPTDIIEAPPAGMVEAVTADANGDFIVCGQLTYGAEGIWYCAKLSATASGFMQGFGTGTFASVDWSPATYSWITTTYSQADGKFLLGGHIKLNGQYIGALARFHNVPDPRALLSVRVHLGGAYDSASGLMRDDLRQQGLLPESQPYWQMGLTGVNGVGDWATPQHVLAVQGEDAVVDWVWLELVNGTDNTEVVATRVGLVHRNGWVTAADGHSPTDFGAGPGDYFVRVRHRNHLSVTSSEPVTLGPVASTLDFTDPMTPTFGTDAQMELNGVRMLWPGDVNRDGRVKYVGPGNDRDLLLIAIGGAVLNTASGYRSEDVNMDGVVKYVGADNDRDVILQTIGGAEVHAARFAQEP